MSLRAGIYTRSGGSSFPTVGLPSADSKTKRRPFNDTAKAVMAKRRHGAAQRSWESTSEPSLHLPTSGPAAVGPTPSRLPGGRVSSAGPGATVGSLDMGVCRPVCCGPSQSGHEGRKDRSLRKDLPSGGTCLGDGKLVGTRSSQEAHPRRFPPRLSKGSPLTKGDKTCAGAARKDLLADEGTSAPQTKDIPLWCIK